MCVYAEDAAGNSGRSLWTTAIGAPAPVPTKPAGLLVGNSGQTIAGVISHFAFTADQDQAFTTGSNAQGYKLTRLDLWIRHQGTAPSYSVKIYSSNSSGSPDTSLGTLTKPSSLPTGSFQSAQFTASEGGIDLAANTTYFVVVDSGESRSNTRLRTTSLSSEDTGGAAGWSIADNALFRDWSSSDGWTVHQFTRLVAIYGYAKSSASKPAKPTGLMATAGNARVELTWTDPNDASITEYQYLQKAGNESYGSWTDIPNSAPGEANATSYTVTSLENGTAYRFRIRAVNAAGNSPQSRGGGAGDADGGHDGADGDGGLDGVLQRRGGHDGADGAGEGRADIYTKVTFSEDMTHVKSDEAAARPELFYRIGTNDTQYDVLNTATRWRAGDCKPNDASDTDVYVCRYTVGGVGQRGVQVKVGTNSVDEATTRWRPCLHPRDDADAGHDGAGGAGEPRRCRGRRPGGAHVEHPSGGRDHRQVAGPAEEHGQTATGRTSRAARSGDTVTNLSERHGLHVPGGAVDTADNDAAGTAGPATPQAADTTPPTIDAGDQSARCAERPLQGRRGRGEATFRRRSADRRRRYTRWGRSTKSADCALKAARWTTQNKLARTRWRARRGSGTRRSRRARGHDQGRSADVADATRPSPTAAGTRWTA